MATKNNYCPILTAAERLAAAFNYGAADTSTTQCLGTSCAWFIPRFGGGCAFTQGARIQAYQAGLGMAVEKTPAQAADT